MAPGISAFDIGQFSSLEGSTTRPSRDLARLVEGVSRSQVRDGWSSRFLPVDGFARLVGAPYPGESIPAVVADAGAIPPQSA